MIKRTIILGYDAVIQFKETGTIPSDKWFNEHGGCVKELNFNSMEECGAYMRALADFDGWGDYELVESEDSETTITHMQKDRQSELFVFLYHANHFARNAKDSAILAAWEKNASVHCPVRKLTLDEFAELCNDESFDEFHYWVRFINN